LGQQAADRNQDATVYVGNLDLQVRAREGGKQTLTHIEARSSNILRRKHTRLRPALTHARFSMCSM